MLHHYSNHAGFGLDSVKNNIITNTFKNELAKNTSHYLLNYELTINIYIYINLDI